MKFPLRNGNLAILLTATMFPVAAASDDDLSAGALYVALFYGGASLIFALITVGIRHALARWLENPAGDPSDPTGKIPSTGAVEPAVERAVDSDADSRS